MQGSVCDQLNTFRLLPLVLHSSRQPGEKNFEEKSTVEAQPGSDLEAYYENERFKVTAAICVNETMSMILGTSTGIIHEYSLKSEQPVDSESPRSNSFKRNAIKICNSSEPVKKFLYSKKERLLLVLIGAEVHILRYPGLTSALEQGSRIFSSCLGMCFYSKGNCEFCIFLGKNSLDFFNMSTKTLDTSQRNYFHYPSEVLVTCAIGSTLVLGCRSCYYIYNINKMNFIYEVHNDGTMQTPIVLHTGEDEFLLYTITGNSAFVGVLINSKGDPTRKTIDWDMPALSSGLWGSCIYTLLINSEVVVHCLKTLTRIAHISVNPKDEPHLLFAFMEGSNVQNAGMVLACRDKVQLMVFNDRLKVLQDLFNRGLYDRALTFSDLFSRLSGDSRLYSNIKSRITLQSFSENYYKHNITGAFDVIADFTIDPRIIISLMSDLSSLLGIPSVESIRKKLLSNYNEVDVKQLSDFSEFASHPLAAFIPVISLDNLIDTDFDKNSDKHTSIVMTARKELYKYMLSSYRKINPGNCEQDPLNFHEFLFFDELNESFPELLNDLTFYISLSMIYNLWLDRDYVKAMESLSMLPMQRCAEIFKVMESCKMWYLKSKLHELEKEFKESADIYLKLLSSEIEEVDLSRDKVMSEFKKLILTMDPQSAKKYTAKLFSIDKGNALDVLLRYEGELISDDKVASYVIGDRIWKVFSSEGCIESFDQLIDYINNHINIRGSGSKDRYTFLMEVYFKRASIISAKENVDNADAADSSANFKLEKEYLMRSDKSVSFFEFLKSKNSKLSLTRLELIGKIESYFCKYDINKVNTTVCSLPGFWEEKARILRLQEVWFLAIETATKIEDFSHADRILLEAFKKVEDAVKCNLAEFFISKVMEKYKSSGDDAFIESLLVRYSRYLKFITTLYGLPDSLNPRVFGEYTLLNIHERLGTYLCDSISKDLCMNNTKALRRKLKAYSHDSILLENSEPQCTSCGEKVNLSDAKILPSKGIVHSSCAE